MDVGCTQKSPPACLHHSTCKDTRHTLYNIHNIHPEAAPTGLAPLRLTTIPGPNFPIPPPTATAPPAPAGPPLRSPFTHPGTSASALALITSHTFGNPTKSGFAFLAPVMAIRCWAWLMKPWIRSCSTSDAVMASMVSSVGSRGGEVWSSMAPARSGSIYPENASWSLVDEGSSS